MVLIHGQMQGFGQSFHHTELYIIKLIKEKVFTAFQIKGNNTICSPPRIRLVQHMQFWITVAAVSIGRAQQ